MTTPWQSRRSFLSVLTSLAGVTAVQAASSQAASQVPAASAQSWDLRWLDDLKAQHKEVFDMADSDPAAEPPPLRLPRNYLDGFRDVYKLEFPEVRTIIGISGRAFPVNASDRLWEKYALGERSKIIDPVDKEAGRAQHLPGRQHAGCQSAASARHDLLAVQHCAQQHRPATCAGATGAGGRGACRLDRGIKPGRASCPDACHGTGPRPGARRHLREDLTTAARSFYRRAQTKLAASSMLPVPLYFAI